MTFGSVCSGIEAASVAWYPLGWCCAWVSEIEPFPCALIKHRFPSVPNYGDFTRIAKDGHRAESVDLLVGGTPCQSFSVAGKRAGLDDPRGNLALEYLALAGRLSEDGTGRGTPITLAIRGRREGRDCECRQDGTANAVLTPNGGRDGIGVGAIATASSVRRLTPRECERLQGFPDDWTRIPWRGKPAEDCPDGPRYKAIGNSMAVPVMRWIGERIEAARTA